MIKDEAMVKMTRGGMKKIIGGFLEPSKNKKGSVARLAKVPGAFGRNPIPKKERNKISGFFRLGRL